MKERNLFHTITIAVIVLWLLLFALIPNIIMFVVSFLEYDSQSFVKAVFTLENYKRFFSGAYLTIFLNSFKIAAVATFLCLIIGYPFAYILARSKSKYKGLLALIVVIPYWTSALIRTYAISYMLAANGLINTILLKLGIIDSPLSLLYTEGAIVFGFVYTLLPFMILPLYATIEKFDFRYIEAAQDLGASKLKTFYHIILPLTSPGIIAGTVLVFLPALGLFYIPSLLGGGKNLMVSNIIQEQFTSNVVQNWPLGSAASVLITVIMGIMIWAYYKSSKSFRTKVL